MDNSGKAPLTSLVVLTDPRPAIARALAVIVPCLFLTTSTVVDDRRQRSCSDNTRRAVPERTIWWLLLSAPPNQHDRRDQRQVSVSPADTTVRAATAVTVDM